MPKVSIVIPIHEMENGAFFLWRAINSIMEQTFKDYEIIITKDGKMAENTNAGIKKARGELIKILYMDDWFARPDALKLMVSAFDAPWIDWYMVATDDNPTPTWTGDLEKGNNKLGSPSALIFKNDFENNLLFDENLSWLLDCDLYTRMTKKYGMPPLSVPDLVLINIGKHSGQMTNIMSDDYKLTEHEYMQKKYE